MRHPRGGDRRHASLLILDREFRRLTHPWPGILSVLPPTALLLEGIHDAADVRLQSDFIDVQRAPRLSDASTDTLKEAMAMGIRSRTHLDAETHTLPAEVL